MDDQVKSGETDPIKKPFSFSLDSAANKFIYGASILCVAMIFFAGNAISFAMLSAMLGTASVMYFMFQLRTAGTAGKKIWNWCIKHSLIVDILMGLAFGYMFGITTATGVLAAGAAGVMNSAVMNLIIDYTPNGGLVDVPPKQSVVKTTGDIRGNNTKIIDAEYTTISVA